MRHYQKAFTLLFVLILGAGYLFPVRVSAVVSTISDQLDRMDETTASGHTIKFVTSTGITAGQTLVINFPAAVFTFGSAYNFSDMSLAEGSTANCDTATFTAKTLAALPSGTTWGATYAADVVTFTSGTDTITANRCVRIILATNGGTHALTNPTIASNTSYVLTLTEAGGDIASFAVLIINDAGGSPNSDQVDIQAILATTLSFDLDVTLTNCNNSTETNSASNIVAFSTLAPGIVKHSDTTINFVCLDVATSSANGINVFIRSSRANTVGGLVRASGGVIPSATADLNSGLVTQGYGARISSVGTPLSGTFTAASPFNSATIGSVGAIPGASASPATIVSSTAPAQTGTSSRIAVELSAKASTGTSAGAYTDTLTFTATANF